MLRLTVHKSHSETVPLKIDTKGQLIIGAKSVGKEYFDLLFELCRFDIASNNSKKEADTSTYILPSNDSDSLIVDRRGNFIRIPLELHLKRLNLAYPATVDGEVIHYLGSPVLKLYTKKIESTPKSSGKSSTENTEDDLSGASAKEIAKENLNNKRAKEVPKKTTPTKGSAFKGKNDALNTNPKKIGRPAKKGTKVKAGAK